MASSFVKQYLSCASRWPKPAHWAPLSVPKCLEGAWRPFGMMQWWITCYVLYSQLDLKCQVITGWQKFMELRNTHGDNFLWSCELGHSRSKDQDGMKTAALRENVLIKAANKEQIMDTDSLHLPLYFDKAWLEILKMTGDLCSANFLCFLCHQA